MQFCDALLVVPSSPRKTSEIPARLREIRVKPVKSLGQNFLHDRNLSRWIVSQIKPGSGDYVVEIGPGLGALTGFLLDADVHVLAIEKDARLAEFLSAEFCNDRLEVLHGDALKFDVRTLFAEPNVKLIGNLPYYISTQILLRFLEYPSPISLALFMLQREVAQRLSASPGHKDYGALTLLVQFYYRVELLKTIRPAVFIPRPEVESSIVRLTPRSVHELPECDHELFSELVRRGFSHRRKQLGKLLRDHAENWPCVADSLGLAREARAEALTLRDWVALAGYLRPPARSGQNRRETELFPVVDENDRVLYHAPRAKVHGDNLRHRAVHILIFNEKGEVFLQKRSRWKDRHPWLWDSSAAGHVEAGEDYDQTAARELREELGITLPLRRITTLAASDRTGQEFIWLYCGEYSGEFTLNREEIDSGRFFPPSVVTKWVQNRRDDFAPAFTGCWNAWTGRTG